MKNLYLEVTFRRGKPLAAYLYLPRPPRARSARTADAGHGLRVDYDEQGVPLGVEVTATSTVSVADVNAVLATLGVPALGAEEWAPLRAA